MMDEINYRWYFLVELYFILRYPEFSWMPFALNMFKNKKIKTFLISERAPFNKGLSSWEGEREREGKGFFGGRPIGRPETNSGSGQLRIFFGQLEADHGVKWTWGFGHVGWGLRTASWNIEGIKG